MSNKKKAFEDLHAALKRLDAKRAKETEPAKRALLLKQYEDLEQHIKKQERMLIKKNRFRKFFESFFKLFF